MERGRHDLPHLRNAETYKTSHYCNGLRTVSQATPFGPILDKVDSIVRLLAVVQLSYSCQLALQLAPHCPSLRRSSSHKLQYTQVYCRGDRPNRNSSPGPSHGDVFLNTVTPLAAHSESGSWISRSADSLKTRLGSEPESH